MVTADSGYLALCREFPLRIITDSDDCIAALKMIRKHQGVSRANQSDGERVYMETLHHLVSDFQKGFLSYLRTVSAPDRRVLKYLMACRDYPDGPPGVMKLAQEINYPPANLLAVLGGQDTLCREAISRLSRHLKVPPDIFDCGDGVGRDPSQRRFRVYGSDGQFTIQDLVTKEEASAGPLDRPPLLCVAIGDLNGNTHYLDPRGMDFKEEFSYQLNEDKARTLAAFFPETWKEEQAEKKKVMNAVWELNKDRRMFFILNHAILDARVNEVLVFAEAGDARIHEDWYEDLDVNHLIRWHQHVRGAYYPSEKLLLFYTGEDHSYSETVRLTACRWLKEITLALHLPLAETKLGLGTVQGQPGVIWKPQVEWGLLVNRLAELELCI